jgi:hypothetical protein
VVEHGTDAFKNASIERFCNTVVLRGVVGGKSTLSAFLLKELSELVAGVLTATIRAKGFDFDTMLSLSPSCKGFVSVESFVFSAKDVDTSVTSGIICKK